MYDKGVVLQPRRHPFPTETGARKGMNMSECTLKTIIVADLARRWPNLSETEQAWAIERGYARSADVSITLGDVQAWQDDWLSESGAAWPCYELHVSVDGNAIGTVTGWHLVGPMGPDGNRQYEEWSTADDDGVCGGKPHPCISDDQPPCIKSGDNVGAMVNLPLLDEDGCYLIYDADDIQDDIDRAARKADHGDEPTWEDADIEDAEDYGTRYIIKYYRVLEVCTRRVQSWQTSLHWDAGRERGATYYVTAWTTSLHDTLVETESEALESLREESDDGKAWTTKAKAEASLAVIVDERLAELDDLPDMEHDRDEDGKLYLREKDADEDDEDARYHLTPDETARVCQHGWLAILNEVVHAFGRRAALNACRSWQEEMDAIITERDPWVLITDSIAGGNCPAGSRSFAATFAAKVGAEGEIGAAKASAILAIKDDTFTRRACRMAAARVMQTA